MESMLHTRLPWQELEEQHAMELCIRGLWEMGAWQTVERLAGWSECCNIWPEWCG